MIITWYGEGCFRLQSGELSLLTDPFESKSGLSAARFKADATLKTLSPFPPEESVEEGVLKGAGEYNLKGINIQGIQIDKESTDKFLKTAYLVEIENIKVLFLGHISEVPDPVTLEHFEEVDILVLPGGGGPFLDQKAAAKLVKQLQPKIVIPSFFKVPGLKRTASGVEDFLEEMALKKAEPQEKLTIKSKEVDELKTTQVIVLKV